MTRGDSNSAAGGTGGTIHAFARLQTCRRMQ
jgi:hypothetical protein